VTPALWILVIGFADVIASVGIVAWLHACEVSNGADW